MIKKFRKKPVVIEALKWEVNYESLVAMSKFIGLDKFKLTENDATKLSITTLEGDMIAAEGDWIIKGVNGEFYPCKPDIFEKTYEEVSGD